jgi:hypothetical protein
MLFFVVFTLQSKKIQKLQRRKTTVHRQLELWPLSQSPSPSSKIWKTISDQQKQDIITTLADLISKMVRSGEMDQEESHER